MAERRPAPTLLIVEDDRALGEMLTDLFSNECYLVDVAHDGQQALHRGLTGGYDAMIVDRGLPVMDGSELVAVLRSRDIETPALLLTARGSLPDRVEGLDAGEQFWYFERFDQIVLRAGVEALDPVRDRPPRGEQQCRGFDIP